MVESGDEIGKRMARETLNKARTKHQSGNPEDDEMAELEITHERSKETKPRVFRCESCGTGVSKGGIFRIGKVKYCAKCFTRKTGVPTDTGIIEEVKPDSIIVPLTDEGIDRQLSVAIPLDPDIETFRGKVYRQCFACGGHEFNIDYMGVAHCCECGAEYKITERAV